MTKVILGSLLCLASLWGGAYALNEFPPGTWQSFPTFATAFLCFFAGIVLASWGTAQP